jgi:hypothetical protein
VGSSVGLYDGSRVGGRVVVGSFVLGVPVGTAVGRGVGLFVVGRGVGRGDGRGVGGLVVVGE